MKKIKKIKSRLIIYFSTFLVLVLAIVIGTQIVNSSNIIVEITEENLKDKAIHVSLIIENEIKDEINQLVLISNLPYIVDEKHDVSEKVSFLKENLKGLDYLELFYVDLEGNGLGTNDIYREFSNEEYFKNALIGKNVFVDPILNDSKDKLIITLAVPIMINNKIGGVLVVSKDGEILSEIAGSVKYGEKGYATILNNKGTTVAHPQRDLVFSEYNPIEAYESDETLKELSDVVQLMIKGNIGTRQYVFQGEKKLWGYAPVKGTNLFVGITAPTSENLAMQNNLFVTTGIMSAIILIVSLLLINFMGNIISRPLILFSKKMEELNVESIAGNKDYAIEASDSDLGEITVLKDSYNKILSKLKENAEARDTKEWLQLGQVKVNELIQKNDEINVLANSIISFVTKQVSGQVGVFYVLDKNQNVEEYNLIASYAYKHRKASNNSYKKGEGYIGQVALEKEMVVLNNIPDDYISMNSGLGSATPKNIVILPCLFNEEVIAILEIGFISEVNDTTLEYLGLISNSIAISISNMMNFENVRGLLIRTKEQSEELSVQHEELQAMNEELLEQTAILENSQSELESQQEELRVINEELEQNTKQLEIHTEELKKKNIDSIRSREEIEQKAKALEMSNSYKSEFLANMSHELRTPLNSILILSELLSENNKNNLSDREIEFADTINTSGKDLLNLINDILDLSKIESGNEEINIENVNIDEFILEITNLFEPIAKDKGVEFEVNKIGFIPNQISMDNTKVKQIVKNLLSNAFKFTDEGKVEFNIEIINNVMHVEVVDTGIGIKSEKIDMIFEAFKQEDGSTSREYGGTGLGLSISKSFSKLIGGNIIVESIKGKGSKFILHFPINNINKTEKASTNNIMSGDKKENNGKDKSAYEGIGTYEACETKYVQDDRDDIGESDKSILIIDDDANFASVIRDICRDKGFKTIVSETGENGLFLADYHHPNAIILDINLPGINGWEVMERLKENKKTSTTPVYLISGVEKSKDKSLNGALKYFTKPVSKEQINKILLEATIFSQDKLEKIMIIEDDEIQRNSIVELVRRNYEDIDIISCGSGNKALQILETEKCDLIVLDLGLADYEKFEFIETLKENEKYKELPIIVYTGQDISIEDEKNLRDKVVDIIIKGDQSSKRLIDEIKLFTHNVSESVNDGFNHISMTDEVYNGKKILVVDDDMRNVFALSSILKSNDMNIVIANDGEESLKVLKEENDIDLIFMDIMMPRMDGYEAMREIRSNEKHKGIPIIALTAKAMKGDREKCIEAGANEYLSKPIDQSKLLSLLRVWINK